MATDVQTRLTYLEWQPSYAETRPYRISQFVGRRKPKRQDREKTTNLVFRRADQAETIRDVRGLNGNFTLDNNGFVYKRCPPPALTEAYEYSDPKKIENVFLPDDALTKDTLDTLLTRDEIGTPVIERIRNHLPEESQHLLSGRIQLINLWRPINGPVEDHPIAVCDRQTLGSSKLIETDMIRGNYTGTMLYPEYEPKGTCQWYYMSGQDVEDVVLFKGFDTKEGCVESTDTAYRRYTPYVIYAVKYLAGSIAEG
ncbi:hypothetical protein BJY04DRAFT_212808 [Aspergillus karnatakaensis]|uniref:uncharacterized protein n=1 Tax=Aspergillus karnatakaensis TaxID=1810916 RepID=UPI003CCCD296